MMTDAQILEVVAAHKEGKKIQFRAHNESEWIDLIVAPPLWNFEMVEYRVAPEPLEWNAWYLPESKGLTDAWMERHQDAGWRPIKVREVATSTEPTVISSIVKTSQERIAPRKPREWNIKASVLNACCMIQEVIIKDEPIIRVVEVLND